MNTAKCTRGVKLTLIATDVIICLSGLIMLIAGSVVQGQINTQKLARTIGGYSTTSGTVICIIFGIAVLLFGMFGLYAAVKDHHRFLVIYSVIMTVVFIVQFITGVVGLSVKNSSNFATYVDNTFSSEFVVNSTASTERDFYQQHFGCCGWINSTDYMVGIVLNAPESCCKVKNCVTSNSSALFETGCRIKIQDASRKVIDVACGILVTFSVFNFISILLSLILSRQIKNGYQYT